MKKLAFAAIALTFALYALSAVAVPRRRSVPDNSFQIVEISEYFRLTGPAALSIIDSNLPTGTILHEEGEQVPCYTQNVPIR